MFLAFRNPKHRIVPAVALAGSSVPAFEDVNITDPDFEYIQGTFCQDEHFYFSLFTVLNLFLLNSPFSLLIFFSSLGRGRHYIQQAIRKRH